MCLITKKIEDLANQTSLYDVFLNALNRSGGRISNLEADIRFYEQLGIIPDYVTKYVSQLSDAKDYGADDIYPSMINLFEGDCI